MVHGRAPLQHEGYGSEYAHRYPNSVVRPEHQVEGLRSAGQEKQWSPAEFPEALGNTTNGHVHRPSNLLRSDEQGEPGFVVSSQGPYRAPAESVDLWCSDRVRAPGAVRAAVLEFGFVQAVQPVLESLELEALVDGGLQRKVVEVAPLLGREPRTAG